MILSRVSALLVTFTLWALSLGWALPFPPSKAFGLDLCTVRSIDRFASARSYSVMARTDRGTFYATGELSPDGVLSLNFKTRIGEERVQSLSGATEFGRIIRHFGARIRKVEGVWLQGSDNLEDFNRLLAEGKSLEEASAGTWTGRQAAKHGFTRITVSETRGTAPAFDSARVGFERP